MQHAAARRDAIADLRIIEAGSHKHPPTPGRANSLRQLLTIDQVGGPLGKALAPTLFNSLLDRGGSRNVSWKATEKGLLLAQSGHA